MKEQKPSEEETASIVAPLQHMSVRAA